MTIVNSTIAGRVPLRCPWLCLTPTLFIRSQLYSPPSPHVPLAFSGLFRACLASVPLQTVSMCRRKRSDRWLNSFPQSGHGRLLPL
jgi:hypothetical protein